MDFKFKLIITGELTGASEVSDTGKEFIESLTFLDVDVCKLTAVKQYLITHAQSKMAEESCNVFLLGYRLGISTPSGPTVKPLETFLA